MTGMAGTVSIERTNPTPAGKCTPPGASKSGVQSIVPTPKIWATGLFLAASMTTSCFVGAPAANAVPLGNQTTRPIGQTMGSDPETEPPASPNPTVETSASDAAPETQIGSAALVKNLHDRSGLTWDQLSKALGVSRRSLHLWASGGRMNARHIELVTEFAGIVRNAPTRGRDAVRTWLLTSDAGAPSPLEAFKASHSRGEAPVFGVGYTASQLIGVDAD